MEAHVVTPMHHPSHNPDQEMKNTFSGFHQQVLGGACCPLLIARFEVIHIFCG
jgi:hypothetical protein